MSHRNVHCEDNYMAESTLEPGVTVPQAPSTFLEADDLAERWNITKSQVYRLTREGHLPAVRLGRYYRYHLSAIEAFEAAGGVGAD